MAWNNFFLFSKFCSQSFLDREQQEADAPSSLPPPKTFTVQSIKWSTRQQTPGRPVPFPPKLTDSNGYLFIYSLIIYNLSPSKKKKKDQSASLEVLAFPPKSVRKKTACGEVVFGFVPESAESHGEV